VISWRVFRIVAICGAMQFVTGSAAIATEPGNELKAVTESIAREPKNIGLYSRRGDLFLFAGKSREAVADYEKMVALDPSQDAPHWRLGIAYNLAGEYVKAARQFEKYHAYDRRDRENGVWHFLSNAKATSVEQARKEMLNYERFDREPFPALYEMFAGRQTAADVVKRVRERGAEASSLEAFFAYYYGGLNELLLGKREVGIEFLRLAVGNSAAEHAGGGPAYMWRVARVQLAEAERN
jgi:lipoprotein NlpI